MSDLLATFEAYKAASARAWRTHEDYTHGEATPAQVHRDNRLESEAEKAHLAAIGAAS